MKELPSPTFPLSPLALPRGHFTGLVSSSMARMSSQYLRVGAAVLRFRGPGSVARTGKRST